MLTQKEAPFRNDGTYKRAHEELPVADQIYTTLPYLTFIARCPGSREDKVPVRGCDQPWATLLLSVFSKALGAGLRKSNSDCRCIRVVDDTF